MKEVFSYNLLRTEKLDEVLALIRRVFLAYEAPEYSEEGIREFMDFIEPEAIKKMLSENKLHIWTCEHDGAIIGALGAHSDHINLLFVAGEYHRKGIARQLFGRMLEHFHPSSVTVNSSPYAAQAYRRLGFVDTDAEQTVHGIRFIPMQYTA